VNIFGRVTTLTGKIVQTFEDPVQIDVPNDLLAQKVQQSSIYWKALPLRSGRYKVDLVVKDVNGDRTGVWERGIMVPNYEDDKLNSSATRRSGRKYRPMTERNRRNSNETSD
jgi:hypothetical protein